ncbi:hypothetical protein BDV29DRAFT_45458 [Aspergillus leporis]|uniref:Uncharacterized protein n=1 Tax=Aspergillus leporis TaxID=41062 RepID=A0A5N5XAG4_9EURO|nr:hypothetical protein BDV29DRAFT_45458 [Aspergillus leporis]
MLTHLSPVIEDRHIREPGYLAENMQCHMILFCLISGYSHFGFYFCILRVGIGRETCNPNIQRSDTIAHQENALPWKARHLRCCAMP